MDYLNNKSHWREVVDYPNYSVSDKGFIRSDRKGIILKARAHHKTGYLSVSLQSHRGEKRRRLLVHRLVATSFLGKSELIVNHIDGNRSNNTLSNLEWCTYRENTRHRFEVLNKGNEMLRKQVICLDDGTVYESLAAASKQLNISMGNLSQACRGIRNRAGGHHWCYADEM